MVQSASQVRIQYMARRLVEVGLKRLVEGVYRCFRKNAVSGEEIEYADAKGFLMSVDITSLPEAMSMDVDANVGDMGNTGILKKMQIIGTQVIPALQDAGAGAAVNPEAAVKIAVQTLQALDEDPLDYLVDYTDPAFIDQVKTSRENEQVAAEKAKKLAEQIQLLDIEQRRATAALTNIQSKNALQDNTRQMVVAMDKHYQDWAKLYIDAKDKGITLPADAQPNIEQLWMIANKLVQMDAGMPLANPEITPKEGEVAAESAGPEAAPAV